MAEKVELCYKDKVILAPMVRIGTLPMRLLSLRYGADLVYGEEIVDHKMLHCTRIENKLLGTIDFMASDGTIIFRTCTKEKDRVIFQMGTSDPDRALKVAKMVEYDVSGIDINMGCPKEFSIKGGMGAALLTQPEKIQKILTTLVCGLSIPVTCKIRILPKLSDTLNLVTLIEKTGIRALGVHGRWKEERSSLPCHDDYIKEIAKTIQIPVIANGGSLEINNCEDIVKFKNATSASSVMLARSAMWNPSVFRKEGCLPIMDVTKEYLKLAIEFDSLFQNVKYVLCKMIGDTTKCDVGKKVQSSRDIEDICMAYELEGYRQNVLKQRNFLKEKLKALDEPDSKRQKMDIVIIKDVSFNRKLYPKTISPIQLVYEYCRARNIDQPVFKSNLTQDNMYKSELTVDGKVYTSRLCERRKKSSEQAAAIAFLQHHGIHDGRVKD